MIVSSQTCYKQHSRARSHNLDKQKTIDQALKKKKKKNVVFVCRPSSLSVKSDNTEAQVSERAVFMSCKLHTDSSRILT